MPAARSPSDHDPRNPLRCAEAREHQAGRHFEQGVAKKEQATTKTVDRCAELQIVVHLKRGEADVHPVDVGDNVGQENQWHDAPHRLRHCRPPDGIVRLRSLVHPVSWYDLVRLGSPPIVERPHRQRRKDEHIPPRNRHQCERVRQPRCNTRARLSTRWQASASPRLQLHEASRHVSIRPTIGPFLRAGLAV